MLELEHYLSLVLFAVGLLGNCTSCLVWARNNDKIGGARFLLACSVSDLLAILCLVSCSALVLSANHCEALLMMCFGDVFYTMSSFFTIAIVIQRYMSIACPFSVDRLCSAVRQRSATIAMVLLAIVVHVLHLVFSAMRYRLCVDDVLPTGSYSPEQFQELTHIVIYSYLTLNFVPLVLLLVFNVLLLRALWGMSKHPTAEANRSHNRAKERVAVMAVCISSTTILTYSVLQAANLYVIINWHNIHNHEPTTALHVVYLKVLMFIRELSMAFSVSTNVFFYSCFSDSFRSTVTQQWRRLVNCVRTRLGKGQSSSPVSGQRSSKVQAMESDRCGDYRLCKSHNSFLASPPRSNEVQTVEIITRGSTFGVPSVGGDHAVT